MKLHFKVHATTPEESFGVFGFPKLTWFDLLKRWREPTALHVFYGASASALNKLGEYVLAVCVWAFCLCCFKLGRIVFSLYKAQNNARMSRAAVAPCKRTMFKRHSRK